MSRQEIDYKVVGSDKDSGEQDVAAIRPVADGEPAQASVFKRPSENLRTRTEVNRTKLEALNYLSDADRSLLLYSSGTVTWAGLPTGTFTASAGIVLKPFTAPEASSASRLLIGATTASQITIRSRQDGLSGQPRAYSGANAISFDFTPIDTGTGVVVITVDGTPQDNFHVQYDSNVTSGTTVAQMMDYLNNVTPTAGGAAFVAAGLEAVVEGTGSPVEVGFPVPPPPLVGNKVIVSGPEQLLRFMAGAADAEKHVITPAHLTTFFADPLNQLIEGDVMCLRYDDLVMGSYGGRRQSIDEFPENKALSAGLNLFLMRRFPERLPGALPIVTVFSGSLIFVNNRAYVSGETGPLVSAGAFYQGSPASPNSWADGTEVSGPISFETALDAIIQTLGTKSGGTPGAIKVGFTPSGNIAANTVKGALEELDSEKAGLALVNTFTRANTFSPGTATETAITATGNTTGAGVNATGGASNGLGVIGLGFGTGVGVKGTGGATNAAGVWGIGGATNGPGMLGQGTGSGAGASGTGGATSGAIGVLGTGGSTDGVGVKGVGVGAGKGVYGVGGGTNGTGVAGDGGATNGVGVVGTGAGTGAGVTGTGGVTGEGGTFLAGGSNTNGVTSTATGSGVGVQGNAANSSGFGVRGQGSGTSAGVKGIGGATNGSIGVWGVGGSGGGTGVLGQGAGTSGGVGVDGSASGAGWAGVFGFGPSAGGPGVVGNGKGLDDSSQTPAAVVGRPGFGEFTPCVMGLGAGSSGIASDQLGAAVTFAEGGKYAGGIFVGLNVDGDGGYGCIVAGDAGGTPKRAAFKIIPQQAAPTNGTMGDMYVGGSGPGIGKLHIYNGSAWVVVGTQS